MVNFWGHPRFQNNLAAYFALLNKYYIDDNLDSLFSGGFAFVELHFLSTLETQL